MSKNPIEEALELELAMLGGLGQAISDHVSGEGTRRNSRDTGIRCDVCGRTTLVVSRGEREGELQVGCAYAIGGGLCTNYIVIKDATERAELLNILNSDSKNRFLEFFKRVGKKHHETWKKKNEDWWDDLRKRGLLKREVIKDYDDVYPKGQAVEVYIHPSGMKEIRPVERKGRKKS